MKNSWVFLAGLSSLTLANLMMASVSSSSAVPLPRPEPAPVPVAAPQAPALLWLRAWGALPSLPLPCGRLRGISRPVLPPAGESAHADASSSEVW